jgi:hypothetical protein
MIKQTWNINEDEKLRILNLHESATKNLYLIKEQEILGKDNENAIRSNDKNDKFTYLVFQPTTSTRVTNIDWNEPYIVVADDEINAYVAQVVEKDAKNRPIKFKVELDRPLPVWEPRDVRGNEFKFSLVKTGDERYKMNMDYDAKTKNSLVYKDAQYTYYAVIYRKNIVVVPVLNVRPRNNWDYEYEQEGVIDFNSLEENTQVEIIPRYNVFVLGKLFFGLTVITTFGNYQLPKGRETPPPPPPPPPPIIIPPPPPSNLGDNFGDNISFPSENIKNNPNYLSIVKFVKGNKDISKYVFRIQSSASKCKAGTVESQGTVNWKDDKTTYPDVAVDPKADTKDVGNLNLTKARAQHLKDFLIQNLPELKNVKFEVIAQGSKGTCGTEEENAKNRVVALTISENK